MIDKRVDVKLARRPGGPASLGANKWSTIILAIAVGCGGGCLPPATKSVQSSTRSPGNIEGADSASKPPPAASAERDRRSTVEAGILGSGSQAAENAEAAVGTGAEIASPPAGQLAEDPSGQPEVLVASGTQASPILPQPTASPNQGLNSGSQIPPTGSPLPAHPPTSSGGRADSRSQPGDTDAPLTTTVVLQPESNVVQPDSVIRLHIRIQDAHDVASVPFHLTFNPGVVRFQRSQEGTFLAQGGKATAFIVAPMENGRAVVVGHSRLGAGPGAGGSGELCVIEFLALGLGDPQFAFARASVIDALGSPTQASFQTQSVVVR